MLSWLVRLAIAAELILYYAIGVHLAVAIAIALGARLIWVIASFALGGTRASPATVLREFGSVLFSNFLGVPFPALVTPRETDASPADHPPVILVHGYFGNRGFWGALLRWLATQGVAPVFAPDFPATFTTIDKFAEALGAAIERISTATGQARVVLICHSMGGLAARRYLAMQGSSRVAKV